MLITVQKYDVRPEKAEAFTKFAMEVAIPALMSVPGLVELRSFRPITGSHQIAVITEYKDHASYAASLADPKVQQVLAELRTYVTNMSTELWGPSPVVPAPVRPTR